MRRKARAGEQNVGARGDAAEVVRFGSRDGVIHLWVSGGMPLFSQLSSSFFSGS